MKTNPTVLVVDDQADTLAILTHFLKKSSFNILIAQTGEEGLMEAIRSLPDIILLDVLMPGINGFEVCRRLKANPETREIPVLFMTALSDTEDKLTGFEVGGVDYLTKPIQHEELMARVNTHLTLRKMRQELQALNETKDKFFSIIAHDLKGPFHGLIGATDFLIEAYDDLDTNDIKKFLLDINRSSRQAFNLLENLLNWSRSQTGDIIWKPEKIDISHIVFDNIDLIEARAREKGVRIINEIGAGTFVYADLNMTDLVLRNLITNALKYTDSGGEIRISAADAGDFQEISVSDTGTGISPENLSRLFRIDAAFSLPGTAREGGTGLGLLLCREFVEKNSGRICVESNPGRGSIFSFTLPKPEILCLL